MSIPSGTIIIKLDNKQSAIVESLKQDNERLRAELNNKDQLNVMASKLYLDAIKQRDIEINRLRNILEVQKTKKPKKPQQCEHVLKTTQTVCQKLESPLGSKRCAAHKPLAKQTTEERQAYLETKAQLDAELDEYKGRGFVVLNPCRGGECDHMATGKIQNIELCELCQETCLSMIKRANKGRLCHKLTFCETDQCVKLCGKQTGWHAGMDFHICPSHGAVNNF